MPLLRLLLFLMALLVCGVADAQIRRCVAADGHAIFTDRHCEDLGAVERLPDQASAGSTNVYRYTCPRRLQDLVFQLTSAIDGGDVNRLASVYYWNGQSTRSGYALMQQLDAIANRPLADIVPLYPDSMGEETGQDPDGSSQTPIHQAPIALRLEQTLANSSTPSSTILGLRRSFGCWWVSL